MSEPEKTSPLRTVLGVGAILGAMLLAVTIARQRSDSGGHRWSNSASPLPTLSSSDGKRVTEGRVRGSGTAPALPAYTRVTGFELTNHLGRPYSLGELTNRIWVADIIFTRCPGPCVAMTRQLAALQTALPTSSPVRLVSLTADPAFDTVPVLRQYAERFGADSNRWEFLTGPKREVYDLAMRQLLLAVDENDPTNRTTPDDLFIHSTKFVLVDGRGQVRGVFEGTEPESQPRLLAAIQSLEKEQK